MNAAKQKVLWVAVAAVLASGPTFADSTANVEQDGNRNSAVVNQVAVPGSIADVYQSGADHTSTISQSNSVFPMEAGIESYGNNNYASIVQDNSWNTTAEISQNGNYNYASISQTHTSDNTSAVIVQDVTSDSGATLTQYNADASSAVINQNHNNVFSPNETSATLTQYNASSSTADITQTYTVDRVVAVVYQAGVENAASILQANGQFLHADIYQDGDLNTALINQSGTANDADISQLGGSNWAVIGQTGTGTGTVGHNVASIDQSGVGHMAGITQNGGGNSALVSQH